MTDDTRCGFTVVPRQPTEPLQDFGNNLCDAHVTVAIGAIRISDGQTVTTVTGGQRLDVLTTETSSDAEATEPLPSTVPEPTDLTLLPGWLQPEDQQPSVISSRYRKQFRAAFVVNEPVDAAVAPLIRDPDARLAEMAVNCLGLIQNVTFMVSALQQSDHQECRLAAINGIRNWLPTDPANDLNLREELNRQFPDAEASTIHRMLWGYGQADASNQFVAYSLVDALAHEHIAVREIGFYYIQKLSKRKFEYRPNASARERAVAIMRLREQVTRDERLPGSGQ